MIKGHFHARLLLIGSLLLSFFLSVSLVSASSFSVDPGAMPVSGATQWPSQNTATFSTGVQFQMVRNIRTSAHSIRLLYLNNTANPITFQASVRDGFYSPPQMVTVNGTTTISIPAYSATTSDVLGFSVSAGDYLYDRSYFPSPNNQSFSSGDITGAYNPENISIPNSASGYNLIAGYATTSTSLLLATSTTFEQQIPFAALTTTGFTFGAYAVIGVPNDPTVRFTTFLGDSKTAFLSPDFSSASGPQWAQYAMGFYTGEPYQDLAVAGDILASVANPNGNAANILRQSLVTAFGGDVVNHYGTNSVGNASDPVAAATNELGYISQLKSFLNPGQRLFQLTLDPVVQKTSTSSWATITPAEQSGGGDNSNGIATTLYLNTLFRTGLPSYIDGLFDLTTQITTPSGYWLPNMTADGIHQTQGANLLMGNALAAIWPIPNVIIAASSANAAASTTSAVISWTTNASSTSYVEYGLTGAYTASTTEMDTSPTVTAHSVNLPNLNACTVYHFRAHSREYVASTSLVYLQYNDATSSDSSFVTSGCTGSASVSTSTSQTISGNGSLALGDIALTVPSSFSATSTSATFQAKKLDPVAFFASAGTPSGETTVGTDVFNLAALTGATTTISTFTNPLTVTLSYNPSNVSGLNTSSLQIYRYDAGIGWTALSNCSVNTASSTVTCQTQNFSDFALFGQQTSSSGGGSVSSGGDGGVVIIGGGGGGETTVSATTTLASTIPGCLPAYLYSTVSGAQCPVIPVVAGCQPGYLYSTLTGALCPVTATTSSISSSASSSATYSFTSNLSLGVSSLEVKLLQEYLNGHGFPVAVSGAGSPGNESDYFGQLTKAALIKFQIANGIKPSIGYFGPITRAYIASH